MSTAESITSKIHEKASADLEAELEAAFKPAYEKASGEAYYAKVKLGVETYEARQLVRMAKKAVFETLIERRQTKAVADFVAKVDSLQDQIDEIQIHIER